MGELALTTLSIRVEGTIVDGAVKLDLDLPGATQLRVHHVEQ